VFDVSDAFGTGETQPAFLACTGKRIWSVDDHFRGTGTPCVVPAWRNGLPVMLAGVSKNSLFEKRRIHYSKKKVLIAPS
jgi:hypothetical protein